MWYCVSEIQDIQFKHPILTIYVGRYYIEVEKTTCSYNSSTVWCGKSREVERESWYSTDCQRSEIAALQGRIHETSILHWRRQLLLILLNFVDRYKNIIIKDSTTFPQNCLYWIKYNLIVTLYVNCILFLSWTKMK